jgi:DNA-binding response OmpR family regulator
MNSYTADVCHDGETGLDNALTGIYDVMILDVMLPRLDGFTVLRRLRAAGNATPVLMLTARSEVSDRVEGLDCGADYYLTKPFEPRELLACIRALTRRTPDLQKSDTLEFGDLTLDRSAFHLSCGSRSVRLSRKEFDLAELLMRNRGQILTKETLLLKIWGYESEAEDNNVEAYISFLRKKLEHLRSRVKIRTIRMVGYMLEESES